MTDLEPDTVIRLKTGIFHVASRETSRVLTELFVRLERSCRVPEGLSRQHTLAVVKNLAILHKRLYDGDREFDIAQTPAIEDILIDLLMTSPLCRFRCTACGVEFASRPKIGGFLRRDESDPRIEVGGRSAQCLGCNATLFEFTEKLLFCYDPGSIHPKT